MASSTRANKRLQEWVAQDPKERTGTAIAKALGVRQPSVSGWLLGNSRPEAHLRLALELLTGGFVVAVDWMTSRERRLAERTPPFSPPAANESHRSSA